LIERAKYQSKIPVDPEFAKMIVDYLDGNPKPLKKLAGGEE
jgi:hypothetical protein